MILQIFELSKISILSIRYFKDLPLILVGNADNSLKLYSLKQKILKWSRCLSPNFNIEGALINNIQGYEIKHLIDEGAIV